MAVSEPTHHWMIYAINNETLTQTCCAFAANGALHAEPLSFANVSALPNANLLYPNMTAWKPYHGGEAPVTVCNVTDPDNMQGADRSLYWQFMYCAANETGIGYSTEFWEGREALRGVLDEFEVKWHEDKNASATTTMVGATEGISTAGATAVANASETTGSAKGSAAAPKAGLGLGVGAALLACVASTVLAGVSL